MYKFNNVNLDPLTETYGLSFYMQYLAHWPEYFQVTRIPKWRNYGKRTCFVDLFVRVSNKVAINMYKTLGYLINGKVLEDYWGDQSVDACI
ncbi:hypothetical protein NQ317_009094 [Molorchus minor]|uniref:N-acetyltransferase domain-containing protein n=1 Tax=Molorchus minor TaxID=1323400 RepID=A0ABQ9JN09_9CUCU|nr:hypothetical protein NQ317_009094 [Molorchus minor]